jgi:hypothetical protein
MNYKNDTMKNKINSFNGQDISEFLSEQVDYFTDKFLYTEGEENAHYKTQLQIAGKARALHIQGA